MTTFREYKAQRPNRILYDTVTFYSVTFGYIRLVDRQIFPKTFAGQVYSPCRMDISESQQSNTPVIASTIKFSRLAQDFKQQLKNWKAYARQAPIAVTYQRFDAADMNTPLKPWTLYINDVSMDEADVTVSLTLKNPINNNIAFLYSVEEFPGLENA